MFYSHDILTSRKYGVATIWLVATLGSRSNLKKVSRKAILDVNVRKACETILTPDAPLALRLQSNLLYGVVRVYSQQCGYVLHDAESARNNMRAILKAVEAAELEPEGVHQARPEQLILPNDPNFLPDFDLTSIDIDENALAVAVDSQQSFLLPPDTSQTYTTSPQQVGNIMFPASQSSSVGGMGTLNIPEESDLGRRLAPTRFLEDDLGLTVQPDGTIQLMQSSPPRPQRNTPIVEASQGIAGRGEEQDRVDMDDGVLLQGDDDEFRIPVEDTAPGLDSTTAGYTMPVQVTQQEQDDTISGIAQVAVQRQKRAPKAIPLDRATELHISDLAKWSTNYLSNMKSAQHVKDTHKLSGLAKRNAEFWVLGPINDSSRSRPLDIFTGVRLLEAFTGFNLLPRGQKRPLDDDEDETPSLGRRVRPREEAPDEELGRGALPDQFQDDDNPILPMDEDNTLEQGRNAPTPLDDRHLSSILPWNQSAGSRHIPSSGSLAAAAAGGRRLSTLGGTRRGSRLTSASPLLGRGLPLGEGDEMEDLRFPDPVIPSSMDDGDFEMFPPATMMGETQNSAQSQWQRAAMDLEGVNFLAFVRGGIEDINLGGDIDRSSLSSGVLVRADVVDSIEFERLLPPEGNGAFVAAQAMMHVLALGSKGLLEVKQREDFGPIVLRPVDGCV